MRFLLMCLFSIGMANTCTGQTLSPRTYESLSQIQQLMSEDKLTEAASELTELLGDVQNSPLALALTLQTFAQLEVRRDKVPAAQQHLQRALQIEGLDNSTYHQLRIFSAQLYFAAGNYNAAINLLLPWLKPRPQDAPAAAFALLAATYYANAEIASGLPYIEEAIKRNKDPKEAWLQMAFAGHYQLQQLDQALLYSDALLNNFPDKKDYWLQKSGILQMQNKINESTATRYAASLLGFEFSETEVVAYAQLLGARGIPYKTALILSQADAQHTLNEKDRRLLLQAWLQARETDKAKQVLRDLFAQYAQTDDGILLLQLYVESEEWQQVLPLAAGLFDKKLDAKQHGLILIYQGIALFRSGRVEQGIESMNAAMAFEPVKSQAKSWRQYMLQLKG
jgi:predicted Zn-dependent protease